MSQSRSQRVDVEFLEQWFHIARKNVPLDHYQLLAIERGEQDRQKIVQAAKLRVATLRKIKDQGQRDNVKAAHKQVLTAANCLCNATQRAAYDQRLDQRDTSAADRPKTQKVATAARQEVTAGTKKAGKTPKNVGHDLGMPSPHIAAKAARGEEPTSPAEAAAGLSKREWLFLGIGMGAMSLLALVAIVGVVVVMKNNPAHPPAIADHSPTASSPGDDLGAIGELKPEHTNPVASSTAEHLLTVDSQESPSSTGGESTQPEPSAGADAFSNQGDPSADSTPPEQPVGARSLSVETEPTPPVEPPPSLALDEEVELPKSDRIDENSPGETVSLGTVPGSMLDALQLGLDSKYVDLSGFHRFNLRPMEGSTGRWEVMMIKHDVIGNPRPDVVDTGIDFDQPLALLDSADEELMFRWNPQNTWAFGEGRRNKFAGQLSNCILLVQHSGKKQKIRLRHLEKTKPLVLRLVKKVEQVPIILPSLPPHETLALQITELKSFKEAVKMNPGDGRVSLDKRGRIEIFVGNKQQIRLRLDAEANEDGVGITFSPYFKLGTKYKPLTPELAQQELLRNQKLLNQAAWDLKNAKQIFKNAQMARKGLGPPPPINNKNFLQWKTQAGAADKVMRKANGTIRRNNIRGPRLQKVITGLQEMGKIATALQKNLAAIEYRITSTVDQEERPLLIAAQKLPAPKEGENSFQNPDARGGVDVLAQFVGGNPNAQLSPELQVPWRNAMPRGHANLGELPRNAPFATLRRPLRLLASSTPY